MGLQQEVIKVRQEHDRFQKKVFKIAKDLKIKPKRNINEYLVKICSKIKNKNILNEFYGELTNSLNRKHYLERHETWSEQKFKMVFNETNKIQVLKQVWIGNCLVDFFIPALGVVKPNNTKGFSFKGIAVEVDGAIHNVEAKMKKDRYKNDFLESLEILVWRVPNEQVMNRKCSFIVQNLVENKSNRLCSRARRQLLHRIQLATALTHSQSCELQKLFFSNSSRQCHSQKANATTTSFFRDELCS